MKRKDIPATICENLDNTLVASITTSAGVAIFNCLLAALDATIKRIKYEYKQGM